MIDGTDHDLQVGVLLLEVHDSSDDVLVQVVELTSVACHMLHRCPSATSHSPLKEAKA